MTLLENLAYMFGELVIPVLISSFIAFIGFTLGTFFVYKHVKKFYIAEIPKGWKFFYIGLLLNALTQLVEVIYTFLTLMSELLIIFFLIFQLIAAFVLVYGLYLLIKEIQIESMVPEIPIEESEKSE